MYKVSVAIMNRREGSNEKGVLFGGNGKGSCSRDLVPLRPCNKLFHAHAVVGHGTSVTVLVVGFWNAYVDDLGRGSEKRDLILRGKAVRPVEL